MAPMATNWLFIPFEDLIQKTNDDQHKHTNLYPRKLLELTFNIRSSEFAMISEAFSR